MNFQFVSREEVINDRKEVQAFIMEVVREKKMGDQWYVKASPEYIACHRCNHEIPDATLIVVNEREIICKYCLKQSALKAG